MKEITYKIYMTGPEKIVNSQNLIKNGLILVLKLSTTLNSTVVVTTLYTHLSFLLYTLPLIARAAAAKKKKQQICVYVVGQV